MHHYKSKSNRGVAQEVLPEAAKQVEQGISVRKAAIDFDIPHTSLLRFVKNMRQAQAAGTQLPTVGYKNNRQILNPTQETCRVLTTSWLNLLWVINC